MTDPLSIARARDEWLKSDVGTRCQETDILSDLSYGQYLRHRLEHAFLAGWNAAERDKKSEKP